MLPKPVWVDLYFLINSAHNTGKYNGKNQVINNRANHTEIAL
jgi:hypothetical protein